MCQIVGKCGCSGGLASFLAALGTQVAWWLLKTLAKAVQLAALALVVAAMWTTPRAWRLARRGYREVRRRYALRPVVLDREPVAAVTATTTAPTLADLRLKEPANS